MSGDQLSSGHIHIYIISCTRFPIFATNGCVFSFFCHKPFFKVIKKVSLLLCLLFFLAHLSRRLTDVSQAVCVSVCVFTLSNINISVTSGPIATKFYLKHRWGGGEAALGFGPDGIGTLVSMAMDSPHRVIMGKML